MGYKEKRFYVYIIASDPNGTLYIGVTIDLPKRIWEHREKLMDGFSKKYGVDKLVYYEIHETSESAFMRETQMKRWKRVWKMKIINEINPDWRDLYEDIIL